MIAEREHADYHLDSTYAYGGRLRLAAYVTIDQDTLRYLRTKRHMTQAALARAAGVSKQTITRMESTTAIPHFSTIERVAGALAVEPEAFVVYHSPGMSPGVNRAGGSPVESGPELTEENRRKLEAKRREIKGSSSGAGSEGDDEFAGDRA